MSEPVIFPIDPVHVMLFARAVCDDNPMYRDAARASDSKYGAIVAPPTFSEALQQFLPEYRWRPQPGVPWVGSLRTIRDSTKRSEPAVLHAEQHFVYHRPIFAGEILHARKKPGNSWQKTSKRHGILKFREIVTEFFDSGGALVLTATAVEVETAVQQ